jgi:predicted ATPase
MIRMMRLQNFKCFRDQTIELGALTLLSGLNGMGKSSVIQSLVLLRQSHQQALLPDVGLSLNGDLIKLGLASDVLYEGAQASDTIGFTLWIDRDNDELEASWSFAYNREADVMQISGKPEQEVYQTSLFTDEFHYLQAERIGPRPAYGTSDFQVRQHRQIGTQGEYAVHFLSVFGSSDIENAVLKHEKAMSLSLLNQVEAWLGEVSPGTRLHLKANPDLDQIGVRYSFVDGQFESREFRSTNVGFGITYTLPILAAVLAARPGALILVENPEAHLHPRGQARIGHLLAHAASTGVQIVIESHSDHVLNGIRLAVHGGVIPPEAVALHYFQRREDPDEVQYEVTSPQIDRDGRIDDWPDGFFDEWNRSLLRLMAPGDAE